MKQLSLLALIGALGAAAPQSQAEERRVFLEDAQGARIEIATLTLSGESYQIAMAEAPFSDHFLSMRPFKCLEETDKHNLVYRYERASNHSHS